MNELIWVAVNAAMYVILLYQYYRTSNREFFNTGTLILGIWAVSACIAIFYEQFNPFGHMKDIKLWPYIYLFGCNMLMFLPLLRIREENFRALKVNQRMLWNMAIFIAVLTVMPFAESFIYWWHTRDNQTLLLDNFNERYQDASQTYFYLSTFSRRCTYVLHAVRPLSIFMSFYLPIVRKKYSKGFYLVYTGILLSDVYIVLESAILLARFQVVMNILVAAFCYLIVRHFYDDSLKSIARKIIFVGTGLFIALQIYQTANRFLNYTENLGQDVTAAVYTTQYLSEGMGNFNGNIVHSEYRLNGDGIVNAYAKWFGLELSEKNYRETRFHTNQFFTVAGEYWRTYGPIGTLIVFLLFYFIFGRLFRRYQHTDTLTIGGLMLMILYARLPLSGIFYNAYFVDSEQLIVMPLIIWVLSVNSTVYKFKEYE